jgi:hypothetical protein
LPALRIATAPRDEDAPREDKDAREQDTQDEGVKK